MKHTKVVYNVWTLHVPVLADIGPTTWCKVIGGKAIGNGHSQQLNTRSVRFAGLVAVRKPLKNDPAVERNTYTIN